MRARTIDKGSGTADLCTQASDDSSGYPTANITQWIFQPGLTITIKQDNSPCRLPLCPLSSTTHTIVGHHDHYQERSCGSWAECRHKLPKRPQGTVQQCPTQFRKQYSQVCKADPECPPTADTARMEAQI